MRFYSQEDMEVPESLSEVQKAHLAEAEYIQAVVTGEVRRNFMVVGAFRAECDLSDIPVDLRPQLDDLVPWSGVRWRAMFDVRAKHCNSNRKATADRPAVAEVVAAELVQKIDDSGDLVLHTEVARQWNFANPVQKPVFAVTRQRIDPQNPDTLTAKRDGTVWLVRRNGTWDLCLGSDVYGRPLPIANVSGFFTDLPQVCQYGGSDGNWSWGAHVCLGFVQAGQPIGQPTGHEYLILDNERPQRVAKTLCTTDLDRFTAFYRLHKVMQAVPRTSRGNPQRVSPIPVVRVLGVSRMSEAETLTCVGLPRTKFESLGGRFLTGYTLVPWPLLSRVLNSQDSAESVVETNGSLLLFWDLSEIEKTGDAWIMPAMPCLVDGVQGLGNVSLDLSNVHVGRVGAAETALANARLEPVS